MEARGKGAHEAILLDQEGFVTEGSHTSFFGVKDGELMTTPEGPEILPGITRDFVIEVAKKAGIRTHFERIHQSMVPLLDEVLLTGTTSEVLPVVKIDGEAIGEGQPGAYGQKLQKLLRHAVVTSL